MMAKWSSLWAGDRKKERRVKIVLFKEKLRTEEVVPVKYERTKPEQWSVSQEWSFVGLFPPVVA